MVFDPETGMYISCFLDGKWKIANRVGVVPWCINWGAGLFSFVALGA